MIEMLALTANFWIKCGMVICATVVNIAAYLVQIEWDGFGIAEDTWALIIMIVASSWQLLSNFK